PGASPRRRSARGRRPPGASSRPGPRRLTAASRPPVFPAQFTGLCLWMRTGRGPYAPHMTSSLRALDRQLLFVQRLLAEDADDVRSRQEAMRLLRDVEHGLARWAAEAPSRAFAARLLGVRAQLSGH